MHRNSRDHVAVLCLAFPPSPFCLFFLLAAIETKLYRSTRSSLYDAKIIRSAAINSTRAIRVKRAELEFERAIELARLSSDTREPRIERGAERYGSCGSEGTRGERKKKKKGN